jgi:uncharacterized protein with HEPN domain
MESKNIKRCAARMTKKGILRVFDYLEHILQDLDRIFEYIEDVDELTFLENPGCSAS